MKFSNALMIAAAVFVLAGVVVQAQPHETAKGSSVQLGDKSVVIPNPEGFEEAASQFEKVKQLFLATEDPSNDMLLGHLPVSDCNLLRNGAAPTLTRFAKISVLRAGRDQEISKTDMDAIVAEFRKNGAALMDPEGPLLKSVIENAERGISKLESKQIDLGLNATQNLGEFDVRPEVYSIMLLLTYRADVGGTTTVTPVLASLSFLKVKQRLLYVTVFQKISSPAALKTELKPAVAEVKQFSTKWINEILAANQ